MRCQTAGNHKPGVDQDRGNVGKRCPTVPKISILVNKSRPLRIVLSSYPNLFSFSVIGGAVLFMIMLQCSTASAAEVKSQHAPHCHDISYNLSGMRAR